MKKPNLLLSLSPIFLLMGLLIINIILFKDEATSGANQIGLLIATAYTCLIGCFYLKLDYKELEQKILNSVEVSLQALLILLVVGSLISLWIVSGIVPAMIYYGLKLIHPSVFLSVSCLVCAIAALATGSSWSTTGTIGVALMAIGGAMGLHEGMVAGAVISGAYFGDKMSPLSDTTNLAPAMAGTDLFTHIRHMIYTTGPAIIIALIGFTILGLNFDVTAQTSQQIQDVILKLDETFNISLGLFIVPAIVIYFVSKKTPAVPTLVLGLLGSVFAAFIFQGELLAVMEATGLKSSVRYLLGVAAHGFEIESGLPILDKLLSRGGMDSMLTTIWLIFCAMIFGGSLEATGMLEVISSALLNFVHSVGGLIGSTLATCIFFNMTACDQYLAIVVPGRMFKEAYKRFGLHPKNLSRALEDSGTVTSVLVPWNSGGAYNSGVLGVDTLTYLPYCFFNLMSPVMSAFLAGMGWTIEREEKN